MKEKVNPEELNLTENLVYIRRVAKTTAGGRRLAFSALMVVGDNEGHVGFGLGKGKEIPVAISKGTARAKKNLIRVPMKGSTITHEIKGKFGAAEVFLKPASPGTGVMAGRAVRSVVEAAGIRDILTKSMGSSNPVNVVQATLRALSMLKDPEEEFVKRGKMAPRASEQAESVENPEESEQ
ncbi:MAG: 30S ribosomal protein S5 [Dehalococcoidia bacterium]